MPIDFSNAWNTGVKIINETISRAVIFTSPVAVESPAGKTASF